MFFTSLCTSISTNVPIDKEEYPTQNDATDGIYPLRLPQTRFAIQNELIVTDMCNKTTIGYSYFIYDFPICLQERSQNYVSSGISGRGVCHSEQADSEIVQSYWFFC